MVHFAGSSHEHNDGVDGVICFILFEKPIVVEINLQQLCQGLQRVKCSIEVLQNDVVAVLFFDFIRVDLAVLLLDKLDEVRKLNICVHLAGLDSF